MRCFSKLLRLVAAFVFICIITAMKYKRTIGAIIVVIVLAGLVVYLYSTPSVATENPKYSNANFTITYPKGWTLNETATGVGIINPERSGKPDTDVPVEGISISNTNADCKPTLWQEGFGLIFYKTVCLDNKLKISMFAFDQNSMAILDTAVNSIVIK